MPVTQLRPEVDFTEHLGPPIIRDSWKLDAQQSTPASRSLDKGSRNSTSLNPLDYTLKGRRNSVDAESGILVPSDEEEPIFECTKRKLNSGPPGFSGGEPDKDDVNAVVDPGTRLYGKSADHHLVIHTVFWKSLHIKEVTPPDPQQETQPSDPGNFPKVRRPIYWGPPFPVSYRPSIPLYVTEESSYPHRFLSGNWNGRVSV